MLYRSARALAVRPRELPAEGPCSLVLLLWSLLCAKGPSGGGFRVLKGSSSVRRDQTRGTFCARAGFIWPADGSSQTVRVIRFLCPPNEPSSDLQKVCLPPREPSDPNHLSRTLWMETTSLKVGRESSGEVRVKADGARLSAAWRLRKSLRQMASCKWCLPNGVFDRKNAI